MDNYPPGVSAFTPDAPWNQPELLNECKRCGLQKVQDPLRETSYCYKDGDYYSGHYLDELDDICDLCIDDIQWFLESVFGGVWLFKGGDWIKDGESLAVRIDWDRKEITLVWENQPLKLIPETDDLRDYLFSGIDL